MLKIRLRRVGKKKQPMYRIVVADSRAPRDGAFVEALGYYHPLDNPSTIVIDADRARHWLDKGAQPSDRVAKILAVQNIAEIPAKLQTRIALGEQRAKEAAAAKPKEAKEAPAATAAPAPGPAPTPAAEQAPAAAAEPAPAVTAADEAPAAEAESAPAEAAAGEAPAAEAEPAPAEAAAETPAAEATPAEEPAEG
jgi:small subunit ribosomal protein S16